jgi:iron(III) transport system permease protein
LRFWLSKNRLHARTLATEVWAHTANVEFAAAAPYAALLIVVSGLPAYLLTTRVYLSR